MHAIVIRFIIAVWSTYSGWLSKKTFRQLTSSVSFLAAQVNRQQKIESVKQQERWNATLNFLQNASTSLSSETRTLREEVAALRQKQKQSDTVQNAIGPLMQELSTLRNKVSTLVSTFCSPVIS